MKPFIKLLPLLLILTLFNRAGFAQAKPVQLSVISIPPSPTYLSDYVGTTSDKIKLQILLTDLNSTREVYLKLNFSGPSIEFLTPDNLSNIPYYTLTGGIPLMLYNADLSYYFEAENTGLSTNDYVQQLNEGAYFICFDVYDKITNQKLSNSTCHSTLLLQNDPPFLNLPFNKEIVQANASNTFQRFQWTPRHTPTSGYHYKFKIAEVKDGYEETPELSLITFGADYEEPNVTNNYYDLPLIGSVFSIDTSNSSKVYVWQVQAYELNGVDTINNFKNNGNSEIWIFKYDVASCTEPDQPVVIETYKTGAKITWSVPTGSNCQVHYREYNTARWFSADSVSSPFLLSNLKGDSTEYEVQIGTMCNGGMFYGPSTTFRTKGVTETGPEISCTISANNGITYHVDKTTLVIGDKFKAGKFTIYIDDSLTKVGANFSGVGHIQVPYLYFANIKVRFKEVSINDSNVMYAGQVVTTWDPTMANIIDLDGILEGGNSVGKVITGDITADYAATWSIGMESDIVTTTTTNADGTVSGVIRIKVGNSFVDINAVLPYSITDKDGNYYAVGKDGKTTKVAELANLKPAGIASLIKVDPTKGGAVFALYNNSGEMTTYAYDEWKDEYGLSNLWSERYEEIGIKRVGAKCIAPAKPDILLVTITSLPANADYKDIKFITGKGIQFTATLVGFNTFKLNLLGGPSGDAQEIFVTYKKNDEQCITFNKLLLAAYEPKVIKIAIVPVGSATIPSGINAQNLQEKLNEIYGPVCISFKLRITEKFDNHTWDNGLKIDGSMFFSNKSSDMSNLSVAYTNKASDEIYLFYLNKLVDKDGNNYSVEGDMPRNSSTGFLNDHILKNKDVNYWARLITHETGHGVFNLKHTFDAQYGFDSLLHLQNNAMAYANGSFFCKLQWDAIHDPGLVLKFLEKDDNSKRITFKDLTFLNEFKNSDNQTITFFTPSGTLVSFKLDSLQYIVISTLDNIYNVNGKIKTELDDNMPTGSLIQFSYNNIEYFATDDKSGTKFMGYLEESSKSNYLDLYTSTISPTFGVSMFLVSKTINNTKRFIYKVGKFNPRNIPSTFANYEYRFGKLLRNFDLMKTTSGNIDEFKQFNIILTENLYQGSVLKEYIPTSELNFFNSNLARDFFTRNDGQGPKDYSLNDVLLDHLDENSTYYNYSVYFSLLGYTVKQFSALSECVNGKTSIDANSFSNAIHERETEEIINGNVCKVVTNYGSAMQFLESILQSCFKNTTFISTIHTMVTQNKYEYDFNVYFKTNLNSCDYRYIPIEDRIKVLKKFLSKPDGPGYYNTDYWFEKSGKDGAFLLGYLITTTPNQDAAKLLLEFKANKYEWLKNFWAAVSTEDKVKYQAFEILGKIQEWLSNDLIYTQIIPTPKISTKYVFKADYNGKGHSYNYSYPTGMLEYYVGFNTLPVGKNYTVSESVQGDYNESLILKRIPTTTADAGELRADGKIYLHQSYEATYNRSYIGGTYYLPSKTPSYEFSYNENLEPFERMVVKFPIEFVQLELHKGDVVKMPALNCMFFDYLIKVDDQALKNRILIDKLIFVTEVGVIAVSAVATGGVTASLFTCVSATYATVCLADAAIVSERLNQQIDYPDLYKKNKPLFDQWDEIKTMADYTSLAVVGIGTLYTTYKLASLSAMMTQYEKARALSYDLLVGEKTLSGGIKNVFSSFMRLANTVQSEIELSNAFINGYNRESVLAKIAEYKKIGKIFNPEEYLSASYIAKHLNKFKTKGSYLVTNEKYYLYISGQPFVGLPDGLFISTTVDIDAILLKAKGNISIIEQELAITPGTWQDKGGIWRIDINYPENFNLRIPNGVEESANELWIPGGLTNGSAKEAVINQVPNNISNIKAEKIIQ